MSEFSEDIARISAGFGDIFAKAAADQNAQKLRIAEGSIKAATDSIQLEKTQGVKNVARALAMHNGSVSARLGAGGGGVKGSGEAILDANTFQAADQAAVLESNAAAKEASVIFANKPILDDPVLAAIQGARVGADVGINMAQALLSEADVFNFSSPAGFFQFLDVPGFDINDLLDGLGIGGP